MFKNDAKVVLYKYCFCSDYWEKYEVQVSKGLHGERILFAGAVNGNKIYLLTNKSEIIMFELVNFNRGKLPQQFQPVTLYIII